MSEEDVYEIEILGSRKDIFKTETKIDVEASLGEEDEEEQILQGFHIQVLNENMFAKVMYPLLTTVSLLSNYCLTNVQQLTNTCLTNVYLLSKFNLTNV